MIIAAYLQKGTSTSRILQKSNSGYKGQTWTVIDTLAACFRTPRHPRSHSRYGERNSTQLNHPKATTGTQLTFSKIRSGPWVKKWHFSPQFIQNHISSHNWLWHYCRRLFYRFQSLIMVIIFYNFYFCQYLPCKNSRSKNSVTFRQLTAQG